MSVDFSQRWAWAEIDLAAVRHNVASIVSRVAPAQVWAVVKANGYGHGSVQVAQAALEAGATGLCVALVDEGVVLRRAGITAPVLVLSEQPADTVPFLVGYGLTPTVTTTMGAAAVASAAQATGQQVAVHIKVDTGMHRVGAQPTEVLSLARYVDSHPLMDVDGLYTHFAVADQPAHAANERQLSLFRGVVDELSSRGIAPRLVHASNSAAALANPAARFGMVRLGIAMYGLLPGEGVRDLCTDLRPAMSLKARVSAVRWVQAGEAVSYGLRRPLERESLVATVPLGYADGVPRRWGDVPGHVLIGGRRRTIAGTVTMDQIMVDCGDDSSVSVGDEVVLIGNQGNETVGADDWAAATGTIGYEITCGISGRIHRRWL
ncbi:MAG: alanine racemase [Acidimicrobiales bacterium]